MYVPTLPLSLPSLPFGLLSSSNPLLYFASCDGCHERSSPCWPCSAHQFCKFSVFAFANLLSRKTLHTYIMYKMSGPLSKLCTPHLMKALSKQVYTYHTRTVQTLMCSSEYIVSTRSPQPIIGCTGLIYKIIYGVNIHSGSLWCIYNAYMVSKYYNIQY